MEKTPREKIALFVFCLLVVAVTAGALAYINVGHNWNVAASNIDDATGGMEGYTAVLYDGVALPASTDADSEDAPVPLKAVVANYEDKNASVLRLDVVHPTKYSEGSIFKCGNRRIGVFSVTGMVTPTSLDAQVDYFKLHKVDFVLCIATEKVFIQNTEGIDVAIILNTDDPLVPSVESNGTYYVDSPSVGKIGAILVSPHNVVSSKDISSL